METSDAKVWATSIDESEASEHQFLDFMVATLNDSWRIILNMRIIEFFQPLIANRNDHWKQQMKTAHRLLSNATDGEEGFLNEDESPEAWNLLSNFLQEELKFLSQSQQEVQAFFLETWPLGDTKIDLVQLLQHLHTSQIAVTLRIDAVEDHIRAVNERFNRRCPDETEISRKAA